MHEVVLCARVCSVDEQTVDTLKMETSVLRDPSMIVGSFNRLRGAMEFDNVTKLVKFTPKRGSIRCATDPNRQQSLRTCKNCKTQFDPELNHPRACRFHTAHFGGETKRKFESVYTGGTMSTPDSGTVFQYWHCCGSEDPFDPGCTAAPHSSYDD
ncbi:hypothetical protein Scep_023018 [Stephania cephalantha]|uniref:Uncharacterized protein n=1 Tax=Stephania cephalantha TaxID=152367 RepID=A0AAP0F798_9MAGN